MIDPTSVERQALAAIRQLRDKLESVERARREPIAIVGLGCRMPGAPSPAVFWDLLAGGRDAIRPLPAERWGGSSAEEPPAFEGGVLDRIDGFDAEFFGISPREARFTDPQQRLFLEVAWEALEDAGISPTSLKGSATGVFVGTTTTDYLDLVFRHTPLDALDAYVVSGNTLNAVAGRVAFTLGLQGPAIAIDTACSSSLVAIDRACRSLRDGESAMAIAGGVNLIVGPEIVASLARWGMLSPESRCKTFDASADGFVRGEGCGILVLKRLSDAERDGDPIRAVILGSAVNQDGASAGFSVPNGLAQEAVIRAALTSAGVQARDVGYVEAHGTGTPLGDPIEIEALTAVYGEGRDPGRPLLVGSVKTNIGHLEAAAGVAGLLKVVLSLQHGTVPQHLHLRTPNPHIPWGRIPVAVPGKAADWEPLGSRRIGAVSSFGFSGTNVHMVVAEAGPMLVPPLPSASTHLVTLSARSISGRSAVARAYADALESGAVEVADLGLAASAGRAALPVRAAVVGADRSEVIQGLRQLAEQNDDRSGVVAAGTARRVTVGFLFTGQGSQYVGMTNDLAANCDAFRVAYDEASAALDLELDVPLSVVMNATDGRIDQTRYTQPALFALQYGLVAAWRSFGVEPSVVLGHSIGEYAAACCAGVLDLATAARLVAVRARMMGALPAGGAMAAVAAGADRVEPVLRGIAGIVSIAATNAPDETVISGEAAAVRAAQDAFERQSVRVRPLTVSHAFHSPLMDPMLPEFLKAVEPVERHAPRLSVVSTVSGVTADAEFGTARYWAEQIRAPVRYADAARSMAASGVSLAIEIGPHPILTGLLASNGVAAWPVPSLRRGRDGWRTMLTAVGELFVRGAVDDWSGADGARRRGRVAVPTYPFQRTRHWIVDQGRSVGVSVSGASVHPLLGVRLPVALDDRIYHRVLSQGDAGPLVEHRLGDRAVVPAAALLDLFVAAGREGRGAGAISIGQVDFRRPLEIAEAPLELQTIVRPRIDGGADIQVKGRASEADRWDTYASATVAPSTASAGATIESAPSDTALIDIAAWYDRLEAVEVHFGPAFRSLEAAWQGDGVAWGRVAAAGGWSSGWGITPTLLDGCLQVGNLAIGGEERLLLPAAVAGYHYFGAPGSGDLMVRGERTGTMTVNLDIGQADGTPVARIEGLRFALPPERDRNELPEFETRWIPAEVPGGLESGPWTITGTSAVAGLGEQVAAELRGLGVEARWQDWAGFEAKPQGNIAVVQGSSGSPLVDGLAIAQRLAAGSVRRVAILTRAAQAVRDGERPCVELAGLWGLWRAALLESPAIAGQRIDLDPDDSETDVAVIARWLAAPPDGETELAVRRGEVLAARLVPRSRWRQPTRLVVSRPGELESIGLSSFEPRAVGPDEVAIAVEAAGLNFRDVLAALGMFGGIDTVLGGEVSGRIAAVGSAVTDLQVGDAVIALAPGGLATEVVVSRAAVMRRPAQLSPARGAGIPVAYLTAILGLEILALVRPGDRVLVHAGAGGVGQAAIRIAQLAGCEVYATAGSPAKRRLVESLGVAGVHDSRSTSFRDWILSHTRGEGVDVVVNSLSGAAIDAGFEVLRSGGRFLELGKRGIWTVEQAHRAFPGVRYLPFDLGEMTAADPGLLFRLTSRLEAGLQDGSLPPLPVTVHRLSRPVDAFRSMAQGRHTGKLVFAQDLRPVPNRIRPDVTYLISGGTGGIGLEVARELAHRGARSLILLSRQGGDAARAATERLAGTGAAVQVIVADLADAEQAALSLRAALEALPPVRGVIHAAGIAMDGPIQEQSADALLATWDVKVGGAQTLLNAVGSQGLDFFVTFGAGAALLGSAGQTTYAAANAGLEAWSLDCFATGDVASTVAWGRWADVGMAARLRSVDQDRLTRLGIGTIATDAGVSTLMDLVDRSVRDTAVLPMDWTVYLRESGRHGDRRFQELGGRAADGKSQSMVEGIAALPVRERRAAVRAVVDAAARRVLGAAPHLVVDPGVALRDLGLDSLLAVELRNALVAAFGRPLPSTVAFDYPTIDALTGLVGADLFEPTPSPAAAASGGSAAVLAMSDAEAEAALLLELESGEPGR